MLGRSLGFPGAQKANTLESFYFLQPFVFLLAVLVSAIIASSARVTNHHQNNADQTPVDRDAASELNQTRGEQDAAEQPATRPESK